MASSVMVSALQLEIYFAIAACIFYRSLQQTGSRKPRQPIAESSLLIKKD